MKRFLFAAVLLLPGAALAMPYPQTGIFGIPSQRTSTDDGPRPFLEAALEDIDHGAYQAAGLALEEAETRGLSRSVPLFATHAPVQDWFIVRVRAARTALAVEDTNETRRLIRVMLGIAEQE